MFNKIQVGLDCEWQTYRETDFFLKISLKISVNDKDANEMKQTGCSCNSIACCKKNIAGKILHPCCCTDLSGWLTFQPGSSDAAPPFPSSSPSMPRQRQPETHEQYPYQGARKAAGRSTRSDCSTLRQPRNKASRADGFHTVSDYRAYEAHESQWCWGTSSCTAQQAPHFNSGDRRLHTNRPCVKHSAALS